MKLLEQMQQKIKMKGLSPKTFETYAQHCEDFFRFLLKRFGANPQLVAEHRKSEEKPTLRIFAG